MLITHGHADHTADAVDLAKQHSSTVVAMVEVSTWLASKGVENTIGMNKGGTVSVNGLNATMVTANHSSSFTEEDGTIVYLGEPAGFILEFSNGYKIYHAGDTNVFGDMQIIGEIYQPDLAVLPIGDHFTMDPRGCLCSAVTQCACDCSDALRDISAANRDTGCTTRTDQRSSG